MPLDAKIEGSDPGRLSQIVRALVVWGDASSVKHVLTIYKAAIAESRPVPGGGDRRPSARLGPDEDEAAYLEHPPCRRDRGVTAALEVCKLLTAVRAPPPTC